MMIDGLKPLKLGLLSELFYVMGSLLVLGPLDTESLYTQLKFVIYTFESINCKKQKPNVEEI